VLGDTRCQSPPQLRLPVPILPRAPLAQLLRPVELVAVEDIRDATGKLQAFQAVGILPQVVREDGECRLPDQSGQQRVELPGHDLGRQRVGLGQIAEQFPRELPDERSQQRILVVGRHTVPRGKLQVDPARHCRARRHHHLGHKRRGQRLGLEPVRQTLQQQFDAIGPADVQHGYVSTQPASKPGSGAAAGSKGAPAGRRLAAIHRGEANPFRGQARSCR
jgi:hypothetical protein